jgi:hypothetical protein
MLLHDLAAEVDAALHRLGRGTDGCLLPAEARKGEGSSLRMGAPTWRQIMPKRTVDYVDSYVGSQTHGLKKLHGVLSRAKLIGSRVPGPDWSTGAGSSFVICSATCVHRPAAPSCWTIRVRRVSFLSRVTNARGARLFPQSKSVICPTRCLASAHDRALRLAGPAALLGPMGSCSEPICASLGGRLLQTSPSLTIFGENLVQMIPLTKISGSLLCWWRWWGCG